jgi:septal ring factor EnvC (AmiA/AmiB activator)
MIADIFKQPVHGMSCLEVAAAHQGKQPHSIAARLCEPDPSLHHPHVTASFTKNKGLGHHGPGTVRYHRRPSGSRIRMRHLLKLLLFTLLALPALGASKDPEGDLKRVQQRIEQLQRSVRNDVTRQDKLASKLRESEEQVGAARKRLAEARQRIRESDQRIRDLKTERAGHERKLEQQRDELAAEIRAAYVTGKEEHLKLLLSQKDPAALGRLLVYYSYFGKARAGRIAEIEAAVSRLEALAAEEQEERDHLAVLQQEREKELAAVDVARQDREQALVALRGQIKSNKDSLSRLKREAQGLEKLIADLRRALSQAPAPGGQPFERVRGKLPWPVPGKIVAGFGQPRGGGMKWNGVLIATERGTEVRAPYGGRVVYSDWLPGLGLLLIIDHGGGYMTLYGHNEQLYKAVGDTAAAGEVIATVGDTGGQARPELYLEVRKGTAVQDPRRWFRGSAP